MPLEQQLRHKEVHQGIAEKLQSLVVRTTDAAVGQGLRKTLRIREAICQTG